MHIRKSTLIIISAVFLFTLFAVIFLEKNALDPYRGTVDNMVYSEPIETLFSSQDAATDLRFFYTTLKNRHPAWKDGSTEKTELIDSLYRTSRQAFLQKGHSGVSVLELWQTTSRMASVLHDGHTSVWCNQKEPQYISDFTQFNKYGTPATIGTQTYDDVYSVYKSLSSWEIEKSAENSFITSACLNKAYLQLCGIDTSNGIDLSFTTENGIQLFHYQFTNLDDCIRDISREQKNSEREKSQLKKPWIWYSIDTKRNAALLTVRECNFTEEYCTTVNNFFNEVLLAGIGSVIVDLRGNGGGNSSVANEFIRHLPVTTYNSWDSDVRYGPLLKKYTDIICTNNQYSAVFSGTVYVLTDIKTYSAAMNFAMLILDNHLGYIVGEASGNRPTSYGDILSFQMPKSKLPFCVSYKKWYRVDRTKGDSLIEPDYPCNPDDALKTVYSIIQKQS